MKLKFLLPLLCGISFLAPAQQVSPSAGNFVVEKNVAVPMRDGVILRADVLRPSGRGAFPVLVYRTPYGKEPALEEYTTFRHAVEHGYAVVVQDVRGRYASDGEFRPYENEGRDGYDTIEWAARQPWSNGAVGTFGLSYPGAVQWLAAVENPPHLKAMVPAMTFSSAQNFFYAGGLWDMSWIEWIWDNIAPDIRAKKNLPGPKTPDEAVAAWSQASPKMLSTVPLDQLQELRGIAPYYYDWLTHPYDDPWWDWCDLRNKYGRVHAAVLNFSGWYDDNYGPEGATTNFAGLLKARTGAADPRTHLLIGPWVHGVDSTGKTKSGEREFGPAAAIDYDEVVLRWMDHYLRGMRERSGERKSCPLLCDGRRSVAPGRRLAARLESGVLLSGQPEIRRDPWQPVRRSTAGEESVSDFSVRSGEAGGQFVQQLGRARLPGFDRAARCSDFRFGPARARHRSDRPDPRPDLSGVRLSRHRFVGTFARCGSGRHGFQSDEPWP